VRRRLIVTVAAAVGMVLVAMLVPMVILMRDYALEDRLSRAALEVQATETVVAAESDRGTINVYLDRINDGRGIATTVLFSDGSAIGPDPGEDERVREARLTGRARVDDVDGGTQLLIPVSLGGSSGVPERTPVIRVIVERPGLDSGLFGGLAVLVLLGCALLVGALLLADRIGRSFVGPIREVAAHASDLGSPGHTVRDVPPVEVDGPQEVRDLAAALNRLVARIQTLLDREREANADVSHRLRTPMTALRLRVDALDSAEDRERLSADLDDLQATVDAIIRESRRSQREGLVAASDAREVVAERVHFWQALAEEQGRPLELVDRTQAPAVVGCSQDDLVALLDVLLDNVFTHAPAPARARVTIAARPGGGTRIVVEDAGPGFPSGAPVVDRGASGSDSTGLGLAIVAETAASSGDGLTVGRSELGGASVTVDLGPA